MSSDYERDVTVLLQSLNNDDYRIRTGVILLVRQSTIPTRELVPILEKALKDSSPAVRLVSTWTAFRKGRRLSTADAHAIEGGVGGEDLNLTERLLLIGYYCRTPLGSRQVTKNSFVHVRWVIENAPESEAACSPETTWFESATCREYEIAKRLWMNHLARDPENLSYLMNAAFFFRWYDSKLRHDCLTKGQSLEPWNPYWSQILAIDEKEEEDDDDTDWTFSLN